MKNYMILSLFFLLFINWPTFAQKGCIASGIPLQVNGTLYQNYNSLLGSYDLYGAKITAPYTTFCIVPTGYSCIVRGLGAYNGTEVTYGPLPCSIDSSIYLLTLSTGLYLVFRFGRKT